MWQSYLSYLAATWTLLSIANCRIVPKAIPEGAPTASLKNGTYYGVHSESYNQDFFLGIPFAQPPVGNLRFQVPQSLNTTWSESKNATQYGYQCVGYGNATLAAGNRVNEDCLTLNVIRPTGYEGVSLPVAVWIFGGGFVQGSNSDPRYNLSFIVDQSTQAGLPMVAIGINYRLSAWGFLFSKEILDEGVANLGLRDQRLALHWIQENIEDFGGDPAKVTIWGQSAGGASVGNQLIAYNGRDDKLFRAAISESGSPLSFSKYSTVQSQQLIYNNITNATGCGSELDTLACLRAVPYATLNSVINSSTAASGSYTPTIDGDFIQRPASLQLAAGDFVRVPYLIGGNTDEGTNFGPVGIDTTAQLVKYLGRYSSSNETISNLLNLYPDIPGIGIPFTFDGRPGGSLGLQYKRSSAIAGDFSIHANRRGTAQAWAAQNVSCFNYRFNVMANGYANTVGVTHFAEVAFVMYNIQGLGYPAAHFENPFANKPLTYVEMARLMSRMWISFVVTGDPNNSGVPAVHWPKYSLDTPQEYVFDVNTTNYIEDDYYRAEAIQFIIDNFNSTFAR